MLISDKIGRHWDDSDALSSLSPLLAVLYLLAVASAAAALLGFR